MAQPKTAFVPSGSVEPGAFVFCDRVSGVVRFHVEADHTGMMPTEQSASLLAIHCLVNGNKPEDYTVLIAPRTDLLNSVGSRAQELIEAGRSIRGGPEMSRREHEVLECIVQNLSNKEISSRLNVSVRTVKFHVSSLLLKFKVANRWSLIREAARGLRPNGAPPSLFDVNKNEEPAQPASVDLKQMDAVDEIVPIRRKGTVFRMPGNTCLA